MLKHETTALDTFRASSLALGFFVCFVLEDRFVLPIAGYPGTQGPPAFVSQVLGWQASATIPSVKEILGNPNQDFTMGLKC